MESFKQKYSNYSLALERLEEAIRVNEPDELQIDGIIQRFEFTFELAWKTLKEYLEYNGFTNDIFGPRGVLKVAFQEGIIYDADGWESIIEARNNMSHRYDYTISREIFDNIKNRYIILFRKLKDKLKGEK